MRNDMDFKTASIFACAGIFALLLLLLIPSGRAFAQTYGWHDTNCAWPGNALGPFPSAMSDYNACLASYYALGGSDYFQFDGEYNGPSQSDPACTDPPNSAGLQCWVHMLYSTDGIHFSNFGWEVMSSEASPQFWISGNSTLQGDTSCHAKNCAGDPINPATGDVFSNETDISFHGAGAVAYQRYYNSVDSTGADGVPGWRHSYDRYINVIYANPVGAYSLHSGTLLPSQYSTAAAACTSGFSDLKNSVPGWSSATASYSNGLCLITLNSLTIAALPINSAPIANPPQSSPIEYDVVRDDGQILRYPVQGGVVINPPGISIRFSVTGSGYTVTDDDDTVEVYNSSGVLQSITSRTGVLQTISYSGGLFSRVTDSFGNSISVARNAQNNIGSVSVSGAGTVQYTYNGAHQLSQVTNLDSTTQSYTYDPRFTNALTGIIDENGITYSTWTYDAFERGIQTREAGSVNTVNLTYTSNVSVTTTDALGASRTFSYTRVGDINKVAGISGSQCPTCEESASTAYDTYGWVASRTDYNGNLTCYANDPVRGLEFVRVEGFASGSTCPPNLSSYTPQSGTLQRKITTTWDTTWRKPTLVTEPNRTTAFTLDAFGNVHIKTITDTSVTPNVARTWTYTYNSYGQVLTIDGPRTDLSDITTIAYYTCSTGTQCGQIETITNALNQITTFNTYNAYGQPLTIIDLNGVVTTLTYDARQRLTSTQVGTETTGYSYWPIGLLETVTLPDSSTISYTYDGAHRLTKITDSAGNYISYTLDALGNRTADNTYDPTLTLRRTHTRVFNTLSQLYQDINAAGTAAVTTTLGYDAQGNQTSIHAPMSRNTGKTFDALNRLGQITDPNSGITQLSSDANDNLASVKDPRNLTTSYTHNGFNDVATIVSPDTGTTINTYDSGGNLKTATDARSAVATYSYDALNRPTQIAYADQTIGFTYDAGTNGKGRLTGAADANHSLSWAYDTHGRVTGKGQIIGAVTKSVGYGYTNGDLTSIVTPSGQTVTYSYTNHQITSIAVGSTTILNSATYFPFGPVSGWTWGNSTSMSRTYDTDGKISIINTAADTIDFGYDNAFRITGITDTGTSANSWTLGYDLLDRISSASKTGTAYGWTYDANGNRLTQTATRASTFTPSTTSNRLNSITGALARTYAYDTTGNTKTYSNLTYSYNDRGRMSSVTVGATTSSYVYSALGQMIKKTVGSTTTLLVYDEAGHLLGEYSSTGALIQETVWMGDIPVATLRPNGSTGCTSTICVFYVHTDQLNAPRKITRPSDNSLMWRWDTDPFGTVAPNQNPGGIGTYIYNLRFPGQYYLAESGLNYNYFRDYDPQTGRYIESDPIGLGGGINTYTYAGGNPVSNIDPTGLTTYVITTFDKALGMSYGSHSALFISRPGSKPFLYDPAGDFQAGQRGSGGYFEGPLLPEYVLWQEQTGSQVQIVPVNTTADQENAIIQNAIDQGDQRGLTCAISASSAFGGACGVKPTKFPGTLYKEAKGASCPVQ